jgi:hypothetical protein
MAYNSRASALALAAGLTSVGCGALSDLLNNPSGLAIQKFMASPREVSPGGAVTLSWDVAGAGAVEIDNGIGTVQAKGSISVRPDRTTTYNISARVGTSSAAASVNVVVTGTTLGAGPSPSPTPAASPSPSPTPAASPTPSPTPTPTPSPTPSPSIGSCRVATMPDCSAREGPKGVFGCCTTNVSGDGEFGAIVDQAQDVLERDRPDLFDRGRIKSEEAYVEALARQLQTVGVCAAVGGPGDEVAVKTSNGFNEQFDVVFSNMYPRRSGYVARCSPARF